MKRERESERSLFNGIARDIIEKIHQNILFFNGQHNRKSAFPIFWNRQSKNNITLISSDIFLENVIRENICRMELEVLRAEDGLLLWENQWLVNVCNLSLGRLRPGQESGECDHCRDKTPKAEIVILVAYFLAHIRSPFLSLDSYICRI